MLETKNRKKINGFTFYINIANFEVFLWNLNLSPKHNLNDWIYTIDGKLDKIPHGANLIKFTEHQRKELINWYDCNSGSSPVGDDVATLMKRTGLSAKQIKHFMEYRRKQDRKG